MRRILIVENDYLLAETIKQGLVKLPAKVDTAFTLRTATQLLDQRNYDLVLLDRLLDDGDGLEIAEYLHDVSYHTKIVMISNIGDLENRLRGLRKGADLYMPKPFDQRELLLHVKNLLSSHKLVPEDQLILGNIRFSGQTGILETGQNKRRLRKKEAEILRLLIIRKNQTVSREQIIAHVWGSKIDIPTYSTIDAYIRKLRVALGEYAWQLKTIRGFGYSAID